MVGTPKILYIKSFDRNKYLIFRYVISYFMGQYRPWSRWEVSKITSRITRLPNWIQLLNHPYPITKYLT